MKQSNGTIKIKEARPTKGNYIRDKALDFNKTIRKLGPGTRPRYISCLCMLPAPKQPNKVSIASLLKQPVRKSAKLGI
jgi:hypothetical protein